jgi:YtcA family
MRASLLYSAALIVPGSLALGGCSLRGAPSLVLFGAYFPAWMMLAAIGIAVAAATRVAILAFGLADKLPYPLFVCGSVGVTVAILLWLIGYAL